ncbi:GAF domain-containing protein [candidate division KSB1 bacterium]|nr:GAF domain-containing protein [candidate division KSB1 bacterium]
MSHLITKQTNITFDQLITLYEVSRKINSQLNFQKLLDEIMDLAINILQAEKGLLLLKEEDSDELTVQVARLMDQRRMDEIVAVSRSIIKKVEGEMKPILLQRVPDTTGVSENTSLIRYKIKSVICVPLSSKDKLIGTIYLDTTQAEHFFKPADLSFLEGFANLAAIAIENAKSYQEIEKLNTNLESQVEKRTEQLKDKNEELITAYDELKDAQMQLLRSEKMASLGMLVAGIAHEINTPLAAINSNTDMFIRSFEKLRIKLGSPDGDPKDALTTICVMENLANVNLTACQRLDGIVKTLKNFARLDEEDFKLVDIQEGLDSTLELTAHLSRNRIKVIKEYGDIPKIRCYANQLNQVFMNLIVNACQAIDRNGTLTIRTRASVSQVHVEISDTGSGIDPKHLSKIFDPGFTTKGVGVGTGLGLSISYKIMQEHTGSIDVESKKGKGTTFTVNIPIENPNAPS